MENPSSYIYLLHEVGNWEVRLSFEKGDEGVGNLKTMEIGNVENEKRS